MATSTREVQVEYLPIDEVRGAKVNPKDHDIGALITSLRHHGFVAPLILDEKSKRLVAGHGRLEALRTMHRDGDAAPKGVQVADGSWLAPVVRGVSFPNPAAAEAYLLADNRVTELGGWNDAELLEVLQEMQRSDLLEATAFDDQDILDLLSVVDPPVRPDENDVPEAPEPRSALGDMWLLGEHRVLCADVTERDAWQRLTGGALVDMVLADPPYNVNYRGGSSTKTRVRNDAYPDQFADYRSLISGALGAAHSASIPEAALHLWHSPNRLRDILGALDDCGWVDRTLIVWDKGNIKGGLGQANKQYRKRYEPLLYAHKKGKTPRWHGPGNESDLWEVAGPSANPLHPTMKPVELYRRSLSNHTQPGETVAECFLGSGTALIAAEETGRTCWGMELEPRFVDVIVQRWEEFTGQKAVLQAS